MALPLSRRQFLALSGVGVLSAAGYGVARSVRAVQNAAARMTSQ
jgi:hypothetical protein